MVYHSYVRYVRPECTVEIQPMILRMISLAYLKKINGFSDKIMVEDTQDVEKLSQ